MKPSEQMCFCVSIRRHAAARLQWEESGERRRASGRLLSALPRSLSLKFDYCDESFSIKHPDEFLSNKQACASPSSSSPFPKGALVFLLQGGAGCDPEPSRRGALA